MRWHSGIRRVSLFAALALARGDGRYAKLLRQLARVDPERRIQRWDAAGKKRKTMVVALARKLLIALWRFVTTGDIPQGMVLRPAQ